MIIKFFPFIQTMIEQSEEITILNKKLNFKRVYGPNIIEEVYDLNEKVLNKLNNLFIEEKELIDFCDVIEVNNIKFNYENSSLFYKEFSTFITNEINFKYNPRAFRNENVLFYLGDFYQMFEHGLYDDAINIIDENDLKLNNNSIIINNELITIKNNGYKILSYNTNNNLYKVIITTLLYNTLL